MILHTIDPLLRELARKTGIPHKDVETIVYHQFYYTKLCLMERGAPSVLLHNFGRFVRSPRRNAHITRKRTFKLIRRIQAVPTMNADSFNKHLQPILDKDIEHKYFWDSIRDLPLEDVLHIQEALHDELTEEEKELFQSVIADHTENADE